MPSPRLISNPGIEEQILTDLAAYASDFSGWIAYSFPWGEEGSELAGASGPQPWQAALARRVDEGLSPAQALLLATTSGHGVGKSAFVSWLILWAMSTAVDTRGVVTANTETQLKTKTWAELAKWFRLFIGRSFFRYEATCIFSRDREHEKTWRIDMVPWSERNVEAFAGLHNKGRRILVVFDEASAIPDNIWETTEGALTDSETEIIWAVFGNPTRNAGRFKQCFAGGQYSHRWLSQAVDSRQVSLTDQSQIERWVRDYGDDSDFVRVRVKGMFPRTGTLQFISDELVSQACLREAVAFQHDPLILGVDVARFGDDASVIYIRKGRDGRTHEPLVFRGLDTMQLAARVAEQYSYYHADAVFIDGGGVGGGVVDRCRQLKVPCFEVQFGGKPDRPDLSADSAKYSNKRAEIWGLMREWLSVGAIPDNAELRAALVSPQYGFNGKDEIQLERKEDMKRRGLASPDLADALALTFAWPVLPSVLAGGMPPHADLVEIDYDPFDLVREVIEEERYGLQSTFYFGRDHDVFVTGLGTGPGSRPTW